MNADSPDLTVQATSHKDVYQVLHTCGFMSDLLLRHAATAQVTCHVDEHTPSPMADVLSGLTYCSRCRQPLPRQP